MNPADRLREIEARLEDTLDGPWKAAETGAWGDGFMVYTEHGKDLRLIAECRYGNPMANPDGGTFQFFAHSKEDVEWLLARVKRLTEVLEVVISEDLTCRHYVRARQALEADE